MRKEYKTLEEMYGMITDPLIICKKRLVSNTDELSRKALQLEQDREILKSFIVRHHPEMEGWIKKNFGREK